MEVRLLQLLQALQRQQRMEVAWRQQRRLQ